MKGTAALVSCAGLEGLTARVPVGIIDLSVEETGYGAPPPP
jgi:hypothetical protein